MLVPIEFFGPLPAVVMQMKMNDVLLQGLYEGRSFSELPPQVRFACPISKVAFRCSGIYSFDGPGKFFCFTAKIGRISTFLILQPVT